VEVAAAQGLSSYRLVVNCGEQAGMSIPHLHVHILGGRRFRWPPG
jgi:histidine triad (HIT) family protein